VAYFALAPLLPNVFAGGGGMSATAVTLTLVLAGLGPGLLVAGWLWERAIRLRLTRCPPEPSDVVEAAFWRCWEERSGQTEPGLAGVLRGWLPLAVVAPGVMAALGGFTTAPTVEFIVAAGLMGFLAIESELAIARRRAHVTNLASVVGDRLRADLSPPDAMTVGATASDCVAGRGAKRSGTRFPDWDADVVLARCLTGGQPSGDSVRESSRDAPS